MSKQSSNQCLTLELILSHCTSCTGELNLVGYYKESDANEMSSCDETISGDKMTSDSMMTNGDVTVHRQEPLEPLIQLTIGSLSSRPAIVDGRELSLKSMPSGPLATGDYSAPGRLEVGHCPVFSMYSFVDNNSGYSKVYDNLKTEHDVIMGNTFAYLAYSDLHNQFTKVH